MANISNKHNLKDSTLLAVNLFRKFNNSGFYP